MTTVVHVHEPFDVYIGRAMRTAGDKRCWVESIWCNPFRLNLDEPRSVALDRYRSYITRRLHNEPSLLVQLKSLRGKRLGCWCKPKSCHGDVLVELIAHQGRKQATTWQ